MFQEVAIMALKFQDLERNGIENETFECILVPIGIKRHSKVSFLISFHCRF